MVFRLADVAVPRTPLPAHLIASMPLILIAESAQKVSYKLPPRPIRIVRSISPRRRACPPLDAHLPPRPHLPASIRPLGGLAALAQRHEIVVGSRRALPKLLGERQAKPIPAAHDGSPLAISQHGRASAASTFILCPSYR